MDKNEITSAEPDAHGEIGAPSDAIKHSAERFLETLLPDSRLARAVAAYGERFHADLARPAAEWPEDVRGSLAEAASLRAEHGGTETQEQREPVTSRVRWMINRDLPGVLHIERQYKNPLSKEEIHRLMHERNVIGMVAETPSPAGREFPTLQDEYAIKLAAYAQRAADEACRAFDAAHPLPVGTALTPGEVAARAHARNEIHRRSAQEAEDSCLREHPFPPPLPGGGVAGSIIYAIHNNAVDVLSMKTDSACRGRGVTDDLLARLLDKLNMKRTILRDRREEIRKEWALQEERLRLAGERAVLRPTVRSFCNEAIRLWTAEEGENMQRQLASALDALPADALCEQIRRICAPLLAPGFRDAVLAGDESALRARGHIRRTFETLSHTHCFEWKSRSEEGVWEEVPRVSVRTPTTEAVLAVEGYLPRFSADLPSLPDALTKLKRVWQQARNDEGNVVGHYSFFDAPHALVVDHFDVVPGFRNRGYGAAMTATLLQRIDPATQTLATVDIIFPGEREQEPEEAGIDDE